MSGVLGAGPTVEFQWIDIENLTEFRACRNSIQGALLIVDERGKCCICTTVKDLKSKLPVIIFNKNWIIGWCNSRRTFYWLSHYGIIEPVYHNLQIW